MGENPELIVMARRIAQDNAPAVLECLFGGTGSDTVKRVVHDGLKAAALAAIIETRDRDAEIAATVIYEARTGEIDNDLRCVGHILDSRIRSGQQFRKDV